MPRREILTTEPMDLQEARKQQAVVLSQKNSIERNIEEREEYIKSLKQLESEQIELIQINKNKIDSLDSEIETRNNSIDTLKNEESQVKSSLFKLKDELAKFNDELNSFSQKKEEEYKKIVEKYKPIISSLEDKIKLLSKDIEYLESEKSKKSSELSSLSSSVLALEKSELNYKNSILPELQAKYDQITANIHNLNSEEIRKQWNVNELVRKIQEIGDIEKELQSLKTESEEAKEKLNILTSEFDAKNKILDEKIKLAENISLATDKKIESMKKMNSKIVVDNAINEKLNDN